MQCTDTTLVDSRSGEGAGAYTTTEMNCTTHADSWSGSYNDADSERGHTGVIRLELGQQHLAKHINNLKETVAHAQWE